MYATDCQTPGGHTLMQLTPGGDTLMQLTPGGL